jgi:hypothetical protein
MAVRKLPLPLFSAKTRVSRTGDSPQYLHFVLAVRLDRNQCAFVCESQSLTILLSGAMVVPTVARRAVFRIHFKENANVNQQGQRR